MTVIETMLPAPVPARLASYTIMKALKRTRLVDDGDVDRLPARADLAYESFD